ncbi:MAG: serine hydrolase [Xanthomonadales bacterium]|nr:serine hydrolase [Xanthomonadales bacterium]
MNWTCWRIGLVALFVVLCPHTGAAQSTDFSELDSRIRSGELGSIKSMIIARDGEVVFERYYRGSNAQSLHLLNSVTKSIGATLLGILNRQGLLLLDESVATVIPRYDWNGDTRIRQNRDLSIAHLLQQRHGIAWDEWSTDYRDPSNPVGAMIRSSDWYYYVLSRPRATIPGTTFAYSTGVSTLMSAVIRSRTGQTPQNFAREFLFLPLGITRVHYEGYSAQGMGTGLTQFPFGDAPLGWAWWMTAADMLKLGELYRNGGVHNGRRIIDRDWIKAAWIPYSNAENSSEVFTTPGTGYGYQWWLTPLTDQRGRTFMAAYANGWGRQYILIVPELDLTIVSTADDYDYSGDGIGFALRNLILDQFDMRMDARFNGSWFQPEFNGQGVNIEILEATGEALLYWYTYDDEGNHRWYLAQGPIVEDHAELVVYQTSGGRFMRPDPIDVSPVGSAQLVFSSCNQGSLQFDLAGRSGELALTRITGHCQDELLPPATLSPPARATAGVALP